MDCCLLSSEEVGRLQHYKLLPCHDDHTHISTKAAIDGLKDESLELVKGYDGRDYITAAKVFFLRALPSGESKIKIVQRVLSNHILELKPIR